MHLTLALGVVTGVLTGLVVAGFRTWCAAARGGAVRWPAGRGGGSAGGRSDVVNVLASGWGDGDTATTDAYVRAYQQRAGDVGVRAARRNLTMSAISLGSGAAWVRGTRPFAGGTLGSAIDRRFLGGSANTSLRIKTIGPPREGGGEGGGEKEEKEERTKREGGGP